MAEGDPYANFKYYYYDPSLAAAVIFTVLFFASSILHTYQLIRTRTWYFTAMVVGGFMEAVGYVGRIISSQESPNWTLGSYIIQAILLLVAPALFAASIYMILGRIILALNGEKYSMIRRSWLTKIFVTGDVVSFLVLSGGSGLLVSNSASQVDIGEKIIIAGLFIQIIVFGIFIFVAFLFHRRMNRNPTAEAMSPHLPWRKHLWVLYTASLLIMIRSLIRVIEYVQGHNGYILSHEIFLYIFDGLPMFIAVAIFNWFHPSELIPGKTRAVHDSSDISI